MKNAFHNVLFQENIQNTLFCVYFIALYLNASVFQLQYISLKTMGPFLTI